MRAANVQNPQTFAIVGFGKRGLLEKGSFQKSPFSRVLENLEILESLQIAENKGESDYLLQKLENLEILEILEIPPTKRPFRNDPFFRSRDCCLCIGLRCGIGVFKYGRDDHTVYSKSITNRHLLIRICCWIGFPEYPAEELTLDGPCGKWI